MKGIFKLVECGVSLLSQFSKILEKLFNERLDKFIDKFQLLNNCQYMDSNSDGSSGGNYVIDRCEKNLYWCVY